MGDFIYNQFKNPTNQGIYYSNHFHNLDTGISHQHTQSSHTHYPGYTVTSNGCNSRCGTSNDPRMNQRAYVKENNSFPDNNKPIIRKQPASIQEAGGSDAFISASIITQPTTRDSSEKYKTSLPKIPTTQGEQVAKKKWQNIYFDKVAGIDGILDIYSNSSERQELRIAQNSLSLASSSNDGTGIDLSSVSLNSLGEGVYSYLDYDQSSNIIEDSNGIKTMTILPLKEPGPPSEFNVVVNLSGGLDGSQVSEGLLNALNKRAPIKYHGKPTQTTGNNAILKSIGIKETIMENIPGDHFHYFPIRDNILNGYVANHIGQKHTGNIPNFPNKKISKYYGTKKPHMSLQISHSHPVNFRLF